MPKLIVSDQNFLRNPLNELLGTQALVRLLRVLACEVDGPLTVPNAAEHAGLTIPGAHKALKRLLQSGFVVRVGGGRKHQYELRHSDKLVKAMARLFQSEKERYEALLSAIKDEIEKLVPYARAAWIQDFPNEFRDPMILGVLHETKRLANYIQRLQKQIYQVERDFDLTIEMNGYTKIDGVLGELSLFHQTHGFYVHGLPIKETATLPLGWEHRVIERISTLRIDEPLRDRLVQWVQSSAEEL